MILGGTVFPTRTSLLQELEQVLLATFKIKVNGAPQVGPETTVTIWLLVEPEIEPLPLMDQE